MLFEVAAVRPAGSVTLWIDELKAGNRAAAQELWNRYFHRLVGLARRKLHGAAFLEGEEDVALSAFDTFYRAAEAGRFPQLDDRDDLWRLLMTITARKALRSARDAGRLKRGGGRARADDESAVAHLISAEPTPEFALQVQDELHRLFGLFSDETLRAIALEKLEGSTNEAIAARLGCAPRTVERKLNLIRTLWQPEGTP